MKQKKCFAILLLCALTSFHILWDRQFSSTDSSDFDPVLPEPVIQINAMEQTPNPLILHASYACLMDAGSHRILYSKNTDQKVPMASTTKIMTALLALESNKLNDVVIASQKAAGMPKVHLGMQPGRQYYMKDLLYSLMLESHNDTAVAIAEHIGGSVEGFADKMNQKAAQLGLNATHFVTPNGLDADGHQSTPADMCRLASYACQNKNFLKIIQTPSKTISDKKGHSYSLTNHDAFLTSYSGALGIKTGFTGKAGYCFVGAAKRENLTLSSCVLASGWPPDKSRKWADTKALMDYGFTHFKKQKISFQDFSKTPLRVADGIKNQVFLRVPEPITLPLASFETLEIHYRLPASVTAPVSTSDPVGTIECRINGSVYNAYPVYPSASVDKITFSHILYEVIDEFLSLFCKK